MLNYTSTITCQGIEIPFDPSIITPNIERPMRNNRYETGEAASLRSAIRPGDTVLELGAGIGFCSTIAAMVKGVGRIVAVEANPELIGMIRETHRLNGVTDQVDLRNGVATAGAGDGDLAFYLRSNFWGSSMAPGPQPFERMVTVPALGLDPLLQELRPAVIVCDIEGGELDLFDAADLSSVRELIIELHPKVYGDAGVDRIKSILAGHGLHLKAGQKAASSVHQFTRPAVKTLHRPARSVRDQTVWPPANPRVLIATCMKDEGPFILEWLAWHKALGVTDIVVFTNDCSDGTDLMLDHLDKMGVLRHLPNPAILTGGGYFQPTALAYLHHMAVFQTSDFVISMDVDEFINIRVGAGRFDDLLTATSPFDALSMTEINHGSNRHLHFEPGWITAQFPLHETETPGKYKARRGVKTITRPGPHLDKLRNHRPDFRKDGPPPIWLDGSGRALASLAADVSENGLDCRGTYGLVSLDHFALRSLDSYLMKMLRGDVVVKDKRVGRTYWRQRNRNAEATSDLTRFAPVARAYHDVHFAADPALIALHDAACAHHLAQITTLPDMPELAERKDWILRECW